MYRDARPSVEGQVHRLEGQLAEARDHLGEARDRMAPLALQLFPLFENLENTLQPVDGWGSRKFVLGCLAVMSLAALPLAIAWRPLRRDIRAARRARSEVKRLENRLDEARRTLRALGDGCA